MDHNIGRLIDLIEHLGLRETTVFVFSSDNGYSCGHHGFWHKGRKLSTKHVLKLN